MTPCVVCGQPGEPLKAVKLSFADNHETRRTEISWEPAPSPGASCSPACASLVFAKPFATTTEQQKLHAWRWRSRRAEVRSERFEEPIPMDAGDREWAALLAIAEQRFPRSEPETRRRDG